MMRDEDYIKASERPPACDCGSDTATHDEACSALLTDWDADILASHAVADDVMRELAEALRDAFCAMFNDPLKLRAEMLVRAIGVLDRYDKLIGDFDD